MTVLKAVAIAFLVAPWAGATVITFNDLDISSLSAIPNGYAGFNWSNFYLHSSETGSGYGIGVLSSSGAAYNGLGNPATFSSTTPFSLLSADFTAAWNDGLSITIDGFEGERLLDSTTITVDSTGPTVETFDWSNVNRVTFNSSGGTPNPDFAANGAGPEFVMQDLTIDQIESTPEPPSSVLIALGMGALALFSRIRRCRRS